MHFSDDARIQISRRMKQKSEKTLYIARNLNHAPQNHRHASTICDNRLKIFETRQNVFLTIIDAKNDKRSEASKNSTIV